MISVVSAVPCACLHWRRYRQVSLWWRPGAPTAPIRSMTVRRRKPTRRCDRLRDGDSL